jgi:hypothetical protein
VALMMPPGLSEAQLIDRVQRLESQLAAVYERLGMTYDDGTAGVPTDVVDLARTGNRMRAAKLYAERTGCEFMDAQRVVNRI